MTPETDENGTGDPRSTLPSSIIAGASQIPNDLESIGDEVQSAPAAKPSVRGRKDAFRAGTVVPHVQRQIKAQHAELQSLKDKIQGMAVAQSQTDAEIDKLATQSQPPKSEIQGLQNHVDNLRGQAKKQKK